MVQWMVEILQVLRLFCWASPYTKVLHDYSISFGFAGGN